MRRKQIIRKIKSSFQCQRCNECCRQPGSVYLTSKDTRRIAAHLEMELEAFYDQYCLYEDGQRVLKSLEDHSCIFLTPQGCRIHEVKPKQCVEYPFKWRDEESFDYCEGIKQLKQALSK